MSQPVLGPWMIRPAVYHGGLAPSPARVPTCSCVSPAGRATGGVRARPVPGLSLPPRPEPTGWLYACAPHLHGNGAPPAGRIPAILFHSSYFSPTLTTILCYFYNQANCCFLKIVGSCLQRAQIKYEERVLSSLLR